MPHWASHIVSDSQVDTQGKSWIVNSRFSCVKQVTALHVYPGPEELEQWFGRSLGCFVALPWAKDISNYETGGCGSGDEPQYINTFTGIQVAVAQVLSTLLHCVKVGSLRGLFYVSRDSCTLHWGAVYVAWCRWVLRRLAETRTTIGVCHERTGSSRSHLASGTVSSACPTDRLSSQGKSFKM